METSAEEVHNNIRMVEAYQRHMRVRESQGRKEAELLNLKVMVWSLTCTLSILLVSLGQVIILRRFFSGAAVKKYYYSKRPQVIQF
ncbi:Transmembrane emp24 domain-containing protein 7 [Homalodisca vitripennis]|nr:Transmembrane emp24 domain-containing protein 7 [Homalodisca vitripennis]